MYQDASAGYIRTFDRWRFSQEVELTATGNVHIPAVLHTNSTGADVEGFWPSVTTTALFRVMSPTVRLFFSWGQPES